MNYQQQQISQEGQNSKRAVSVISLQSNLPTIATYNLGEIWHT
jgi:hypothetical protein